MKATKRMSNPPNGLIMTEGNGTWVYAVSRPSQLESLIDLTGVDREPVRTVACSELAAVIGSVSLERFGETALRRNLEDLPWLEACSRTHHRVVEAVARSGPVVPMPLATVFRDDTGVLGMLAERRADIVSALRRVNGRAEWGVKVYYDPEVAVQGADRTTDASEDRQPVGSGRAYLHQRQAQLSAEESARNAAAVGAHEVHRTLAQLAAATHSRPPQDPRLRRGSLRMVLNNAYLLDDDRVEKFVTAAAALDDRHDAVRVELTGPWPPYSFTALGDPA
jgi:hypothetical protein